MIDFNKPYLTGHELRYIKEAVELRHLSGNGIFTRRCQEFFEKRYGFKKCLLTTSCTDALEMVSLLLDIKPGDEVIAPSFTFVSTVNPFVLRGAKIVFTDSAPDSPGMDISKVEALITPATKAIVVVHYAGIACDMDTLMDIANRHNIVVVEDAAHSVDSFYKEKPLGGIGHLAAFSFHETKNIISGEGGMLVINDERYIDRAEIIWEKGTNRAAFFRGSVEKYSWVDVGSSFLPSEITAAFLYAQIEKLDAIQKRRKKIWNTYHSKLKKLGKRGKIKLPYVPDHATHNAHLFYIVCSSPDERTALIQYLKENEILAMFHYLPLHQSPYFKDKYQGASLPFTEQYAGYLLRLPMYYELKTSQVKFVCEKINAFYEGIL